MNRPSDGKRWIVGGGEPPVTYTYEDGAVSNEAKYVRIDKIAYPGAGREVYYNYPTSNTKPGYWLSRLDHLADDGDGTNKHAEYTYLGAGTVVEVKYPAVTVSSKPLVLTYGTGGAYPGFDRFGRIKNQKWEIKDAAPANVKDQFQYGYDRASNRVSRDVGPDMSTPPTGFDEAYLYDGLHRLIKMNRGDLASGTITDANAGFSQAWAAWDTDHWNTSLDAVGNWTEFKEDDDGGGSGDTGWSLDQNRAHNKVNEIDDIDGGSWVDPIYDEAGNLLEGPWPSGPSLWSFYDEEDSCSYTYDAWNRLVRVYRGRRIFGWYFYDGLHRRIWRIVDGFDPPNRTDYYYNTSWQVLEERFYDGANPYTTVATDVTCQYVWDPRYIDAPICRDKDVHDDEDCTETDWDTGDDPDEHLYYCQDANFNTTALVERSDGSVVERYVYDPYGKVTIYDDDWSDTVTWGNSKKNEVLYCGYRYDHESRLYHVRHRSYHPTLGRWMQRDPIGYVDGMSLYSYCHTRPSQLVDPTGTLSASFAGDSPKIDDCTAAWCGVWITPDDNESRPGALVISWTQAHIVWDCDGTELDSTSSTKYYYLPVDASGKAGYMKNPGGGFHYSGEWTPPIDSFFHVVIWRNPVTGPGGEFPADCTTGVLSVTTEVRYYSLPGGLEETIWQMGGFGPIPAGDNPSGFPYDPQGPGAYRSDKEPTGWSSVTPSGTFTFNFFYYWDCCGKIEGMVMYEPDLPMGKQRPGWRPDPHDLSFPRDPFEIW